MHHMWNLRVTQSHFGSGYILTGAAQHKCQAATTTPEACNFSQGTRSIPTTVRVNHLSQRIDSFWEAEELGCNPLPTCKTCKNCPDCRYRADNLTAEEKSSVDEMQESLHMENDLPPIRISYPLKPEAHVQKSNHKQALAVQRAHEKRIINQGILEDYNSEMQKAIEAGTVVKLTNREIREWSGGIHYIVLFAVTKEGSSSTKVRIVSDSALKNNITGLSFNDLVKPVPNALSDQQVVTLHWRAHPTALVYDLSKAYQSIKTGAVERHLRRFYYRKSPNDSFETFAIDCNNFGDACASLGLELGKELTASLGKSIDAQAAEQLVKDSFVDDVGGGGTKSDVLRMRGIKDSLGEYSGTVPQMLAKGGFRAKALIMSGDCDDEEIEALGGKFLGISYCPRQDKILIEFSSTLRLDSKKTSRPKFVDLAELGESITEEVINITTPLTKRKVLGFMMSQYDPNGHAAPLLVIGKLMLQKLYGKGSTLAWDDNLPDNRAKDWRKYIAMLLNIGKIEISRSVRTEDCKEIWVVGFWDGSMQAHCGVVYMRCVNESLWGEESIDSNLLLAKTRVAPLAGTTIPRMELQGLLQLS